MSDEPETPEPDPDEDITEEIPAGDAIDIDDAYDVADETPD
jgi:hypothetical protein